VATAFLNAPMPKGDDESIYVKPPALLEQFHLVNPIFIGNYIKQFMV